MSWFSAAEVSVPPAGGSSLALLTYSPCGRGFLWRGRLRRPVFSRDPSDDSPSSLARSRAGYALLSLRPIFHTHPPLRPLVRERRFFFFFPVSHKWIHRYRCPVWVDGAPRAQLLLLQLWGSNSLLEKRPAKKTASSHCPHFNQNVSAVNCLQYEIGIFHESKNQRLFHSWNHHTWMHGFNLLDNMCQSLD